MSEIVNGDYGGDEDSATLQSTPDTRTLRIGSYFCNRPDGVIPLGGIGGDSAHCEKVWKTGNQGWYELSRPYAVSRPRAFDIS
jgi:hypothetical protein